MFRRIGGLFFQSMLNALENKNISHERIHSPMPQNNIIGIKKPEAFVEDPITEVLRNGAKKLLSEALEAEIESFLRQYKDLKDSKGRQRITANGYLPEREIQTGIGPVSVKVPRARDREPDNASDPLHFRSSIVPPYLRKTRSMEELIPAMHLKRRFHRCIISPCRQRSAWAICSHNQPPERHRGKRTGPVARP